MIKYNKNKPLIAIHIPKTGGGSYREILKKWYGQKYFSHYFDEKNNKMPEKHDLNPGICICGHFNKRRNIGIQDYYPEVKQFITILRDPFEILVSRYFFVKKQETVGKSHRNGDVLLLSKDVDKYLEDEIYKKDYHPNILDYMPCEVTMDNYREVVEEKFIHIGIQDNFQFSMDLIAQKLGFKSEEMSHMNVSERYQSVSAKIRTVFVETHPVEYALYNYVKKKNEK